MKPLVTLLTIIAVTGCVPPTHTKIPIPTQHVRLASDAHSETGLLRAWNEAVTFVPAATGNGDYVMGLMRHKKTQLAFEHLEREKVKLPVILYLHGCEHIGMDTWEHRAALRRERLRSHQPRHASANETSGSMRTTRSTVRTAPAMENTRSGTGHGKTTSGRMGQTLAHLPSRIQRRRLPNRHDYIRTVPGTGNHVLELPRAGQHGANENTVQ